jgi:hypothetical protein
MATTAAAPSVTRRLSLLRVSLMLILNILRDLTMSIVFIGRAAV